LIYSAKQCFYQQPTKTPLPGLLFLGVQCIDQTHKRPANRNVGGQISDCSPKIDLNRLNHAILVVRGNSFSGNFAKNTLSKRLPNNFAIESVPSTSIHFCRAQFSKPILLEQILPQFEAEMAFANVTVDRKSNYSLPLPISAVNHI